MNRLLSKEARLAAENRTKYWAQLDIPIHFSHEKTQVASGIAHPLFNLVLRTNFSAALAGRRVEETVRQFQIQELPFSWILDDETMPENLEELLLANGLKKVEEMRLVIAPPGGGDRQEVQAVGSKEEMHKWCAALQKEHGISEREAARYAALLTTGEIRPLRHFILEREGEAAGAATLFFPSGIAGIHNLVAEDDEALLALTEHLLAHCGRIGCGALCLNLPEKQAALLKPLGFEEAARFRLFSYSARNRSST